MKGDTVYAKWQVHSARVRSALNLRGKSSPWTARGDVTLHGLGRPSARVLDVLDVAWSCRRNSMPGTATSEDLKRGFWANVSQAVQRRPWGPPPVACKSTIMYSFAEDRLLSGHGQLRAMGCPNGCAPREAFSEGQMRCLSGEQFSVPIICMLSFAFYCNPYADWWRQ